jgi:hypothetical protein
MSGPQSLKSPGLRAFYDAAHGTALLTEREKILLRLAVVMSRGCEP